MAVEIIEAIRQAETKATEAEQSAKEEAKQPPVRSRAESILMKTDINTLSPMQAFSVLSDLIEMVKNGE